MTPIFADKPNEGFGMSFPVLSESDAPKWSCPNGAEFLSMIPCQARGLFL